MCIFSLFFTFVQFNCVNYWTQIGISVNKHEINIGSPVYRSPAFSSFPRSAESSRKTGIQSFRTLTISYPLFFGRFVPTFLVVSYPLQNVGRFVPVFLVTSYPLLKWCHRLILVLFWVETKWKLKKMLCSLQEMCLSLIINWEKYVFVKEIGVCMTVFGGKMVSHFVPTFLGQFVPTFLTFMILIKYVELHCLN